MYYCKHKHRIGLILISFMVGIHIAVRNKGKHHSFGIGARLLDNQINNYLTDQIRKQENWINSSIPTVINSNNIKYIVYDCSKTRPGACGGWADRMSGILSTCIISVLTKQPFLVNFDKPCTLQDYLVPATFEWRYNASIFQRSNTAYHNLIDYRSKKIKSFLTGSQDINIFFSMGVNFIRMNWDFTESFRKRPNIGSEIPWLTKLTYADIYKQMFDMLFKPSPLLDQALKEQYRTRRSRPKIACAHVRVGGNPTIPKDLKRKNKPLEILWQYFDTLNKTEYDLLISSDSEQVKDAGKKRYRGNMIDTVGKIIHIDRRSKTDPNEGFLKMMLDFYTLITCDKLIITNSGFGILTAYVRQTDDGLYCWRGRDLRPCSRYTVHNTFPSEILAPGS
ncbi:uncharacterized protein [Argopecten irradians]|uniref:uncharacterized protein n=1 Tax=Argopecten irradians TaxID=31199 RepID=UPI003713BC7C